CVHVTFQSRNDWTSCEDILRCKDNWYHSGPRRDCVLFNCDQPGLAVARLRVLSLPSKRVVDLAVVQEMKRSN
ncbi:hypothetical protein FB45DRAFT_751844, partial [Roridomyces roridus]